MRITGDSLPYYKIIFPQLYRKESGEVGHHQMPADNGPDRMSASVRIHYVSGGDNAVYKVHKQRRHFVIVYYDDILNDYIDD